MKDFAYYNTQTAVALPELRYYKSTLKAEIDEKPLTAKERDDALAKIPAEAGRLYRMALEPYRAAQQQLENEFWADCRKDLGYDKWLTAASVSKVEHKAYQDGHAYGFSEVYSHLEDLVEFLSDILKAQCESP